MRAYIIIYLLLISVSGCLFAMEQAYNRPLSTSPSVIECFSSVVNLFIKKRLCFHLFSHAAHDKNFNCDNYYPLLHAIACHKDDEHALMQTKQVAEFLQLFQHIPWNGKTDTECGYTFHEIMLNGAFVNLGFSESNDDATLYIVANNEDDFDLEMDHRERIENDFKALLITQSKIP